MIYPQKLSSRKGEIAIKIVTLISIASSIILFIINQIVSPNLYWSHLCIAGIVYTLIAVSYSIRHGRSVSNHVVFHSIMAMIITLYIDYRLGFSGWSLNISIPIIIIVANVTMFFVTIFNYKHYGKYALNQLVTLLLSFVANIVIYKIMHTYSVIAIIALCVSSVNFIISIILCFKDLREEAIKKLNI